MKIELNYKYICADCWIWKIWAKMLFYKRSRATHRQPTVFRTVLKSWFDVVSFSCSNVSFYVRQRPASIYCTCLIVTPHMPVLLCILGQQQESQFSILRSVHSRRSNALDRKRFYLCAVAVWRCIIYEFIPKLNKIL